MSRVLFILKKREASYETGETNYPKVLKSSGLLNSAGFVHDMLMANRRESKLVQVIDNNDIDREVTQYRPDVVIIEAFWVVPSKFDVLRKLHPNVHWIIRSHSEIPFSAGEGITMEWFFGYTKQANVTVAFNTERTTEDFRNLLKVANPAMTDWELKTKVWYLPNVYPVSDRNEQVRIGPLIRVGCFGAIRPLKNQLIQAVAAIEYAKKYDLALEFHVNGNRVEGHGGSQKKNLIALFEGLDSTRYRLEMHDWMPHEEFLKVVRQMDIGLQVSFTESFNIVAADFVTEGIPVVTSEEIKWVSPLFYADTTSTDSIVNAMRRAILYERYVSPFFDVNKSRLREHTQSATNVWLANI